MIRYQKGKTYLDFTEAKDIEWQWHQLGHMQVYTSLQTENPASTSPLCTGRMAFLPPNQQRQSTEGNTAGNTEDDYYKPAMCVCAVCSVLVEPVAPVTVRPRPASSAALASLNRQTTGHQTAHAAAPASAAPAGGTSPSHQAGQGHLSVLAKVCMWLFALLHDL